jgi:predicted transcriptional regulator of viral defense system
MLDGLSAPQRVGGIEGLVDALERAPNLDIERFNDYVRRLHMPACAQRLGFLLTAQGASSQMLQALRSVVSTNLVRLDPDGDATGPLDPEWRVQINAGLPA